MESYEYSDKEMYDVALFLAKAAHKGQVDKAGKPYIGHLERVSGTFNSYLYKTIAILHDSLEDTWITEELLRNLFPKIVVDSIVLLTRKKDESYKQFIERMCHDEENDDSFYIARDIKIEDLKDNLNLGRLDTITDEDINRVKKYSKYKKKLEKYQHDIDTFLGK